MILRPLQRRFFRSGPALGAAGLARAALLATLASAPATSAADWREIGAWLARVEAGEAVRPAAGAKGPPSARGRSRSRPGRTAPGPSDTATPALFERLEREHAARTAEFEALAKRALPGKALARLAEARAAYESGQGRLLAILRALAAATPEAGAPRAGEAREIVERLAQAARQQPLSGELKMHAPTLRPPPLPAAVAEPRGGRSAAGAAAPAEELAAARTAEASAIGVIPDRLEQVAAGFDSPLQVYAWVRNNVAPELYHGFMKGPLQTYLDGSGNDADTASLLVALLRAKGFPARYARGTVTVTANRLKALTGAATVELAVRVLERGGIPLDVVQELGLDPEALLDEYLAAPRTVTPLEFARQRVTDLLAASGKTYAQALNSRAYLAEDLGILPNTLPYAVEGRAEVGYLPPDDLRHQVRFRGERESAILLDVTLPLADLLGRRLTLSYVPFDADDASTVAAFGGLARTPPYLVEVKPVLKSGGITIAAGETGVGLGVKFDLKIELLHPGGVETIENPVLAGNLTAIGLGDRVGAGTEPDSSNAAAILSRVAWSYIDRWNRSDAELADLFRVAPVRPTVSACMVMSAIEVDYAGGDPLYPVSFVWKGVAIDADLRSSAPVGVESSKAERPFLLFSGLEGSVLEGRVLTDGLGVESVSTASALQLAAGQGIEVLDLTRDDVESILPGLPFDPVVKEEIRAGALRGLSVRVHAAPVTRLAWTGVGYRILDPETGEAAFQLQGGHSGGVTAPSTLDWPSDLRDTLVDQGEAPAPAGSEVTSVTKFLSTDFQEAYVNEPLRKPLRVLVTNKDGLRVAGAAVTFVVLGGGGSLIDPVSGAPAGPSLTVLSNGRGEAEATLTLGKSTSEIPRFVCLGSVECSNDTETYATQVGLNLVSATSGGAVLGDPFYAYGVPDERDPTRPGKQAAYLRIAGGFDDGSLSTLRVAALLAIDVRDQFDNPISNFPLRFAYQPPPVLGTPPPGWVLARPATATPGKLLKARDYALCQEKTPVVRWGECPGEAEIQEVPSSSRGAFVYPIVGDSPFSTYKFWIGTDLVPEAGWILYTLWGFICTPTCGQGGLEPLVFTEAFGRPILVSANGDLIEAYPPGSSSEVGFASEALYEGYVLERFEDDQGQPFYLARGDNTWTREPLDDSTFSLSAVTPGTGTSGSAPRVGKGAYRGSMTLAGRPQLNTMAYDFKLVPFEIPHDPEHPDRVDKRFVDEITLRVAKQKYPDRPWVGRGTFSLWGVTAAVQSVTPSPIRVDGKTTAERSLVQTSVLPPEYPPLLLPSDVRFDLRRNDADVLSANGTDGKPFEIPKGLPFPPGDYTGHLTIRGVSAGGKDIVSLPFPIQACSHLELLTPVVTLPLRDLPDQNPSCKAEDRIRFRLCEESRVSLNVAGQPLEASVDGGPPVSIGGLTLGPGEHAVTVPRALVAGPGADPLPFALLAVTSQQPVVASRQDGAIVTSPDLVTLRKEVVSVDLILDPVNQTLLAPDQEDIVFATCDAAKVTLKLEGKVLTAPLDGVPRTIADVALEPGLHQVSLNVGELAAALDQVKPFEVEAVSLANPTLQDQKPGIVQVHLTNRSVLPVGHTFVKGVDVFDGHLVQQETDLELPGRHLGLKATRTYSSAGTSFEGELGAGWDWNYAAYLRPHPQSGLVSVKTADGSGQVFRSSGGGFTPQKGYHGRLARSGSGYDYFDKANNRHHFVLAGLGEGTGRYRLDSVEEPHGDRTQLTYDLQSRVAEVAEVQAGVPVRSLRVTWARAGGLDRVKSVEAFAGAASLAMRVDYEYDEQGNLKKATRSGSNIAGPTAEDRVQQYEYTAADLRDRHQMVEARDPNGHIVRYEYYRKADAFPGEDTGFLVAMNKEEFVKRVIEFPGGPRPSPRRSRTISGTLSLPGSGRPPSLIPEPPQLATSSTATARRSRSTRRRGRRTPALPR